jgi:hypothetical protein
MSGQLKPQHRKDHMTLLVSNMVTIFIPCTASEYRI